MADHQTNRPEPPGLQGYFEHAAFRAERSHSGIGAAVWRSGFEHGLHRWDCIVTDGRVRHYIFLTGDLGPRPNLSALDIEEAVEAFASSLAAPEPLRLLTGASPLRIDRGGQVSR